jgi:hypothetical protein
VTLHDEFEAFCREHPVRTLVRDGVECRYRTAGERSRGLLLLPGAVGDGEAYFALAPLVERTHRLVTIAYPAVTTVAALLDAIYPAARVHSFIGAGRALSAERPREWAAVVADFLNPAQASD